MFTLSSIRKSFGGRTLFDDVQLLISRTDRLGLVGPNGAGKSTLFRIILGEEEPDTGQVSRQRGATLGFLPQETAPVGEETVLEIAIRHLGMDDDDHAYHGADGQVIGRAKRILRGLSFRESDFDRPVRTLSGGWIMRAHLARLLVQEPDLLMLDEPTNHLDLETLLWFQDYLKTYPGGIVVISHDREFLNQLVTGILEIRDERVWRYTGNYDNYLDQREARQEQQLAAFKNQQREIGRLMEFVNRFRAKNTKATQAQAKLKQIERMEKIHAPDGPSATVDFAFPQPERSGQRVITLRDVDHAYGDHVVYRGVNFEVERGQEIVLVGPNGAGKSTLLKLLAGVIPVQKGARDVGLRVSVGYYSQHRTDMLNPDHTVLEEALDTPARVTELYVRSLLGCFLFRSDDVFKKVSVLSGGEKSRLALVKLLLNPPNLLLMDEPTTHLDMASMDALVAALSEFSGSLVFISHDVHFIRAVATKVVHVRGGQLTAYAGDYDYYLEKSGATNARAALTAGAAPTSAPTDSRPAANTNPRNPAPRTAAPSVNQRERRQRAADARRAISLQRRTVSTLESEIAEMERRHAALVAQFESPETYATPGRGLELNRQLKAIAADLHAKTVEWENAATVLHAMEEESDPG